MSSNKLVYKPLMTVYSDELGTHDYLNSVIRGDCLDALPMLPRDCVDLIVTSPPYGSRRNGTYGGIRPDDYVKWFLPITGELFRVLSPTGSFVLNIKENVENGERHTYVMELVIAMKKQGWLWTEEYIWHKRNCYPGKWPNRFRDAWEHCFHFTKNRKFKMFQDEVRVPMGKWKDSRLKNLSATDKRRDNSRVGSGFGKKIENWVGKDLALPTNVLHLATECGNRGHSAAYPIELPAWFIRLFTERGDVVLDPFLGSGTTAIAACNLNRYYVGIEIDPNYVAEANDRLRAIQSGQSLSLAYAG